MSKEQVILKLIPVFRQYGYEGTSLSMLSQATGLGKASLYHHFPQGKQGMANAVMDYIAKSFEETVLQFLPSSGTPEERILLMCQALDDYYAHGNNNCFLAMMSWGEADKLFHDQVKQQLEIWIDTLTQVLIEAGIEPKLARERSQDAMIEIQGGLILVRILDEPAIFTRILNNMPKKLL
ncbi:MAG: TetR/AcrR family transcriptional regulator [Pleurocapsa minor HA4230-MV1]|jgi:AcrR family transcriptional regulator|nr:TetR/AcrR family transcriptional regulator [Pleurocapsa minor HA4230-MV1]